MSSSLRSTACEPPATMCSALSEPRSAESGSIEHLSRKVRHKGKALPAMRLTSLASPNVVPQAQLEFFHHQIFGCALELYAPSELHLPVSVPVRPSFRHAAFLVNQPPPPQRVGNPQTPLPLSFQHPVPGLVCPDRGPLPRHAALISQIPPDPDAAHLAKHQAVGIQRDAQIEVSQATLSSSVL